VEIRVRGEGREGEEEVEGKGEGTHLDVLKSIIRRTRRIPRTRARVGSVSELMRLKRWTNRQRRLFGVVSERSKSNVPSGIVTEVAPV
jgi:hypothetical protein